MHAEHAFGCRKGLEDFGTNPNVTERKEVLRVVGNENEGTT